MPESTPRVKLGAALAMLLASVCVATLHAANCNANSVASFNTCHTNASNGDTITLTGSFSVTAPLTVTKALTITGSACTLDSNGRATVCPIVLTNNSSGVVFNISLVANLITHLTQFQIDPPGGGGGGTTTPAVQVEGTNIDNRRFRIDHCVGNGLNIEFMNTNTVLGVIDHCSVTGTGPAHLGYTKGSSWGTTQGVNNYGDGAHADPLGDQFGTDKFMFIEDNNLTFADDGSHHSSCCDGQAGGRYVIRYNTLTRTQIDGHGREASRERSVRAIEVYRNLFVGADYGGLIGYQRGGIGRFHDNAAWKIQGATTPIQLLSFWETQNVSPWGEADGTDLWDSNDAGSPFASGNLTACSGTSVTTNQNFTLNQYANYVVKRTSNTGSLSTLASASIVSNTAGANSVLTVRASSGGTQMGCTNPDTFTINKVTHGLDQIGRSGGTDLAGVASPGSPANTQTTSAWYEWNNCTDTQNPPRISCGGGGTNLNFGTSYGTIRANEHYFNDTQPGGYTEYTYPHPLVTCGAITCGATSTGQRVFRYRTRPGEDE